MSPDGWTTRYAEIDRPTPRGVLRHGALTALANASMFSGSIRLALVRPRVHFIYLHHVFDDEMEAFRTLLTTLRRDMQPIGYTEAVERVLSGTIDRPYLSVSFDDGFKNNLAAAQVLDELGMSACFFVCPQVVGEADRETLTRFARERLHLPPVEFMNWDDVESLRKRGHEIGNHTLSHEDLAMTQVPVAEQVGRSLEILRSRLGDDVKHFAWPYGHFNAINSFVRGQVFEVGHASCASGQRGAHVARKIDRRGLCIRRDHVIAGWPLNHALYLIARSARHASPGDNDWPADLL